MKRTLRFAIVQLTAAVLCTFGADVPHVQALQIQPVGKVQPVGLPSDISFGGGGNSFERRVDLSESTAVVGAGIFRSGADEGRAFVFDYSNPNDIQQIAMLRASDNSAGNEFADGVAISGNYVFVSAYGDSSYRGAVYMYDISDLSNIKERKITAFDAAPANYFGFSLAVDGNRLFVGAPKFSARTLPPAAYVIDFTNPDDLQQTKIVQSNIGAGGNYAESVAISGDYGIVGHISDSTAFPFAGSAHLYDLSNLNAIREKILRPIDAPNYNAFGKRVAISGTKALVSVSSDPGPTNNAGTPDGAVWAFDFSDWNSVTQNEFGRPTLQFGGPIPPFGRFLDLQGNLSIAGAFNEDSTRGAIYFHDVSNIFDPVQLLRLPAASLTDRRFGISFATDGDMLIVSDQTENVYLYHLVPEPSTLLLVGSVLLFLPRAARVRRTNSVLSSAAQTWAIKRSSLSPNLGLDLRELGNTVESYRIEGDYALIRADIDNNGLSELVSMNTMIPEPSAVALWATALLYCSGFIWRTSKSATSFGRIATPKPVGKSTLTHPTRSTTA